MNFRLPLLFSFILAASFQDSNAHALPDVVYLPEFLSGLEQFTGNLYKALIKNKEGNFVASPISAMTLLGMIGYGTDGETKSEIEGALHTSVTHGDLLRNYRKLLMEMMDSKGVELHLAHKLFIQNGLELEWVFKHVTDVIYQSSTQNIDFKDTSSAVANINNWSKDKTSNKILEIVSNADVTNTKLLLGNTAYFKGQWVKSFSDSQDETFHLANNSSITTPMICSESEYNHGPIPSLNADYVEVPYESKDSTVKYSMWFLYPHEVNGVDAIGEKLGEINFASLTSTKKPLKLCVPKFEIDTEWDLIPAYRNMGVNHLFSDDANLTNMGRFKNLKVNSMKQKAIISIDEKGTEALSASSIGAGMKGADSMTIDHQFIALVTANNPVAPVFMARIINPKIQSI